MLKKCETADAQCCEDRYPLKWIYFYLTDDCNLRCRHCWISPAYCGDGPSRSFLPMDLFQSILEQGKAMKLRSVKLTGGEPLLHPYIEDILKILKTEDLSLVVETNGVLCSKEIAKQIAACRNPFVSVSLDGADRVTHEWVRGVAGSFDAAVRGIQNLVTSGIRPQVIMTVMKRNQGQMEALVKLAQELGAASVKFNLLQPTARGDQMHHSGETLDMEDLLKLGEWVENVLSREAPIRVQYHHPAAFRPLGRMFGDAGDGCGACGILGILGVLADGSYALCGIGKTTPGLVFGHAGRDSLQDVWRNTSILREIREGLPLRLKGICGDCLLKELCKGACLAQNYYNSHDIWSPFWYCEAARAKGLFPRTRAVPSEQKGNKNRKCNE